MRRGKNGERIGKKKKRKNKGESKVEPAIVAVCANLAQILLQKNKKFEWKNPKKLQKDMRSPEDKWPFIFRQPPIFPPSPKTVTSTKNMHNSDRTRNIGFVYISVWPKCVVRTQLTS